MTVSGKGRPARFGAADLLALAAAPTFLLMALVTAIGGNSREALLCGEMGASPLGGMAPMYLLMAAFHLAPWLGPSTRRSLASAD